MTGIGKRSIMTLYSNDGDIYSHQCRLVLAEKAIAVNVVEYSEKASEEFIAMNPYNSVPMLVDRDLVLYEAKIIMEYVDERFPHPPLLPVYPVARARSRLMLYRIDRDWYRYARIITDTESSESEKKEAKVNLADSLNSVAPLFQQHTYFMSNEFTLIDCVLSALLWRLPYWGVRLPKSAHPIIEYSKRLFMREPFLESLTKIEHEMGELS